MPATQDPTTAGPVSTALPREGDRTVLVVALLSAGLAVLVGLALLPQRTGLWLDEVYSLELSRGAGYVNQTWPVGEPFAVREDPASIGSQGDGSVWSVIRWQTRDAHPPVYFAVLRLWRSAFGDGATAARSLSLALAAVGAAVVAGTAAHGLERRRSRVTAAAVSGVTLALAVPAAWYSTEIRGYVLATTLVAAAVALAHRADDRRAFGSAWVVVAVLALLTHYFAGGAILGVVLGGLVDARRRRRALASGAAALAAFALLWGWALAAQSGSLEGFSGWVRATEPIGLVGRLKPFLGTPAALLGAPEATDFLTGGALLLLGLTLSRVGRDRVAASAVLVLLGQAGLLLAVDLSMGTVHQWQLRYALPALPAVAVLAGRLAGAFAVGGRWRWAALAGLACPLVAAAGHLRPPSLATDWPSLLREALAAAPDDGRTALVFAVSPAADAVAARRDVETAPDVLALQFLHHSGGWKRGPVLLLDRPPTPAAAEALSGYDRVLFVTAWRQIDARIAFPRRAPAEWATFPTMGVGFVVMRSGEAVSRSGASTAPSP